MLPVSGQTMTMDAPGVDWQVEFFDTTTGESTGKSQVTVREQRLRDCPAGVSRVYRRPAQATRPLIK